MKKLNKEQEKAPTLKDIAPDSIKTWQTEHIILGILAKKLGVRGLISIDLKKEDFPNLVDFSIKKDKLIVYAE